MLSVLDHVCDEPDGKINRHVYPLILTLENLKEIYERSKKHRVLFVDDIYGDFHKFCEVFIGEYENGDIYAKGLYWIIDDYIGLFSLTDIEQIDATAHFTFFDGRFKGRHELVLEMIKMVFNTYKFSRITVEIGAFAGPFVFKFVDSLGFKREGKKRSAVRYKDSLFDLYIYGLLRSDLEKR